MINIQRMRAFKIAFVIIIYSVLSPFLPVQAYEERVNNDYFAKHQEKSLVSLLSNVERYHLSGETFWKKFDEGQYQYAIGDLTFVLRYFPNHPKALHLLGRLAIEIQTPTLPNSYYLEALELFPQHAYTYAQYGNYLAENSEEDVQIKEGISELMKAIEINPKQAEAYAWLAKAYHKIGNSELALQAARKAEELGYQGKILDEILKND